MYDSISSSGSHPQLTSLTNGNLMIVWDETSFVNKKMYKQIGIQCRNAEGKTEGRDYITPKDSNASYPVISPINERSSFVAYVSKKGDKQYIAYQVVQMQ